MPGGKHAGCGGQFRPYNFDVNSPIATYRCNQCGDIRTQRKRQPGFRTIRLDKWEQQKLLQKISSEYMQHLGHYLLSGLFDREVDQANRLGALMHKLGASGEPYTPLPYLGVLPNGRRSDGS